MATHPPCRTCPYWEPVDGPGSTFGACRVNPPTDADNLYFAPAEEDAGPRGRPSPILVAQWPTTLSTSWCSSHPQSREWVAAWEVEQIQRGREEPGWQGEDVT